MDDMTQMQMALMPSSRDGEEGSSWFEAMADAWGEALNAQATKIEMMSDKIAQGAETPADLSNLTAESLAMGFVSNSAHTALTAVGSAQETLARKQ